MAGPFSYCEFVLPAYHSDAYSSKLMLAKRQSPCDPDAYLVSKSLPVCPLEEAVEQHQKGIRRILDRRACYTHRCESQSQGAFL